MSKALLSLLEEKFGAAILETHTVHGDDTAVVDPARWREIAQFLRTDPRATMNQLVDLCGVDYPDREPRFEVVAHLRSLQHGHRLRIKTRVGDADGEGAEVASLVPVWSGANWLERETYDLMGIRFIGHPDLRRILMYDEFVGHPLRKDYAANKTQPLVEYRDVPDKLPPFGPDMGMSFGRQTHAYHRDDPLMVEGRHEISRHAAELRTQGAGYLRAAGDEIDEES